MAVCPKCGAQIDVYLGVCTLCGGDTKPKVSQMAQQQTDQSITKCNNCGCPLLAKTTKCPQCGKGVCSYCGNILSPDIKTCPKCGKRAPIKITLAVIIAAAIIFLAVFIPMMLCVNNSSEPQSNPTPKPEVIHLNAVVQANNYIVSITNNDTQDWLGVHLYANGFDYKYIIGLIAAGQTITANLNDFATYKGDRFNPYLKKLQTIYITSESPDGAGAYGFDY